MNSGMDPSGMWQSMTEQFRRVFGDDFVQNLMKSVNLSDMANGAGFGGMGMSGGSRQGESGIANGGVPFGQNPFFPFGKQGVASEPGSSNQGGQHQGAMISFPRIDVYTTRHEVIVLAEVPGASPGDVKISVDPEALVIRGHIKNPLQPITDHENIHVELFRGDFTREIALPVRVRTDKVRASYRQGFLEIRMMKDGERPTRTGKDVPIRFE